MRYLFLDDDDLRHELFAEWHSGDEVVHAHTVQEFIDIINNNPAFDVMSLDHDLNDFRPQYQSLDERGLRLNGQDVAEFLTKLPIGKRPKKIIIHSWNFECATFMKYILEAVYKDIEIKTFDMGLFMKRLDEWYVQGKKHPYHIYPAWTRAE